MTTGFGEITCCAATGRSPPSVHWRNNARCVLGGSSAYALRGKSNAAASPYSVRATDWAGNRGVSSAWVVEADGSSRRLVASDGGAASARWAPDGQSIYFLSSRGGSNQVWRMDREGMAAVQVTTLTVPTRRI